MQKSILVALLVCLCAAPALVHSEPTIFLSWEVSDVPKDADRAYIITGLGLDLELGRQYLSLNGVIDVVRGGANFPMQVFGSGSIVADSSISLTLFDGVNSYFIYLDLSTLSGPFFAYLDGEQVGEGLATLKSAP